MDSTSIAQVFDSDEFGEIRVMDDGGRPLFCAKDVALALGYSNPNKAIRDHCRGERIVHPFKTAGGVQEVQFITEGDMYRLIASSKLEGAQRFESWVFDDVVPSIRRDGAYVATNGTEDDATLMARALLAADRALSRVREQNAALADDNARMLPKAEVYDVAIRAEGTMSLTEAARYLGQIDPTITRKRLIALLRADGLLCERDNSPTRRALDTKRMRQMLTTRADGKANRPYAHLTRKGLDWCVRAYCRQTSISGE